MNFTPNALTSVEHKYEGVVMFSGRTKSLTESYLETLLTNNNSKRNAKYDMYKAIMSTNNPYLIESAIKKADKFKEEFKDINPYYESFEAYKKTPEYTVLDSVLESNYEMAEEIEQIKFLSYMKECMILTNHNGHFSQLVNLREATGSKIKNTIDKAIAAIRRIFQKFMEKLRSIGKDRRGYLEKYKQTILSQKPKAQKVKVYDYKKAFDNYKVPVPMISFAELKNICNGIEDDYEMQEAIFKKFNQISNGYDSSKISIAEHCKDFYKVGTNSERIEVEMQQINMTDIYNFLHDEKKIIDNINADLKKFESHMNRLSNEARTESEKVNQSVNNKTKAESVYSAVRGCYITEFEVTDSDTSAKTGNTTVNQNQSKTLSDNIQNVPQTNDKEKPDTANFDGQYVSNYIAVVKIVLAAKMTSVEAIGKDLFALVRNHVKNFINDETYVSTQKQGSDYSKNQK